MRETLNRICTGVFSACSWVGDSLLPRNTRRRLFARTVLKGVKHPKRLWRCLASGDFSWHRWRYLLEEGAPFFALGRDGFPVHPGPVRVEHHNPYLSVGAQFKYRKNSFFDPESIRNILVVKLDHIGDVILGLPAIQILQAKFPKAHLTILIGTWAKPIVETFSEIDDILTFDFFFEESGKRRRPLKTRQLNLLENTLRSRVFDLAIDLRRRPETREVLKLSGARYTAGYCTGLDDGWLTTSLELSEEHQDRPARRDKPHMTAQLCQLVRALPTNRPPAASPVIPVPQLTLEKELPGVERYSNLLQGKVLVGLHPGSGDPTRQWPLPYFARLADLLIEGFDAKVVLFGGKREKRLALKTYGQIKHKDKVVFLAGETSLEEFMALVKHCHLFIGNNSGPCHIAGILDVPTLAVFSGIVLPHEWQPLGEKSFSIRLDLPCSPCYKGYIEQCPFDFKCMKCLWPEKVFEGAGQLLKTACFCNPPVS